MAAQFNAFHSNSFSLPIGEDKENQKRSLSSSSSTAVCSATKRRRFRFSSPVVSSATVFNEDDDNDRIQRSRDLPSSRRDGSSSFSRKSCLSSSFSSTSSSVKEFDAASSSSKTSTALGMAAPVVGIISAGPTRVRRIATTVGSSFGHEEGSSCGSLSRMAVKTGGRKIDLGGRGAPGADIAFDDRERRGSSSSSSPTSLSSSSEKDITTLWVGNLPQDGSVDESLLHHMFFEFLSSVKNAKVVRDRDTGIPVGYGFVEFTNRADAEYCLRVLNNLWVPNCPWKYKLNWATFNVGDAHLGVNRIAGSSASSNGGQYTTDDSSTSTGKSSGESSSSNNRGGDNRGSGLRGGGGSNGGSGDSVSIWVGSLDDDVTQEELQQAFEERYQSVVNVRVITDPISGKCRGYGFVHFRDGDEAENALGEMNGALCRGRPMKVNRSNSSRDSTRNYGYGNAGGSGAGATASAGGGGGAMDRYAESAIRKLYYATQMAVEQMASSAASSLSYAAALRKRRQEDGSSSGGAQSSQSQQPGGDGYKVYVTGLDAYVTEELLSPHFSPFGTVVSVSVQAVRGKASITFARESSAISAEYLMNGTQVGSRCVRVRRGTGVIDEEVDTILRGAGGGAAGNGVSDQSDKNCTVSTGDGSSTAGGIASAYTYGRSFLSSAGHGSSTRISADTSSGHRGYTSCSNNSSNSVSGYANSNCYYYTGSENNSAAASMSSTTNGQVFYNYYGIGAGSESASNSYLSTSQYPQYYYGGSDSTSGWYRMNTEPGGNSFFGGYPHDYSEAMMKTDWGLEGCMGGYVQWKESGEVEEEDCIWLLEEYDYAGKGMVIDVLNAMYLRGNPSPMLDLLMLSSSVPTSVSPSLLSSSFPGKEKEDEDGKERNSTKLYLSNGNRDNHEDSSLPLDKTTSVSNDKKEGNETFRRLSISSTSTTTSLLSDAAEAACKRYRLEFDIL